MKIDLPLHDVKIRKVVYARKVKFPAYSDEYIQCNQTEFSLQVKGTGRFYACNGNQVEYSVENGSDPEWVRLFLNGQVMVALLHQRKIINFHASSFIYNDEGVMILGETGAGKSSLTVAFSLEGAGFLTDDLTPVILIDEYPYVLPLYRDVKLRPDTVNQLDIKNSRLRDAEAGTGNHYLDINRSNVKNHRLDLILKIEIGNCPRPQFHEPSSADRFSILRSEICYWEILAGMHETESEYLHQLLQIVRNVYILRVVRPTKIGINDFQSE
jgi:hypothetical protein